MSQTLNISSDKCVLRFPVPNKVCKNNVSEYFFQKISVIVEVIVQKIFTLPTTSLGGMYFFFQYTLDLAMCPFGLMVG